MRAINDETDMCHGAILSKMLMFAFPLMASRVIQLMFNAADIAIVGHFGSEYSLAAVGSTTVLIILLADFFAGLSIGTNVLASRCLGAKDVKTLRRVVHASLGLALLSGLACAGAGVFFAKPLLILMQTPAEVLPKSLEYTRIYFFCMVPMAIYDFGASLLYAKGDTRRPLLFLTVSGGINVLLNLVFVICLKMDVSGVALATVISQTIACVLVLVCLMRQKNALRFYPAAVRFYKNIVVDILKLGLPAGAQVFLFSLSNMVVQTSINGFGPVFMAGSAASQNIEGFVWMCMNTFQPTVTTFVSRNIGAKQYARINKIKNRGLQSVFVTGFVLGMLAVVCGPFLLRIYTSNPETIAAGMLRLRIVAGSYALCGMMDVMTGALRGMGASLTPMLVALAGVCGFRLLWIFTVFQMPAYHSFTVLFLSYSVSWAITLMVLSCCFVFIRRRFPAENVSEGE